MQARRYVWFFLLCAGIAALILVARSAHSPSQKPLTAHMRELSECLTKGPGSEDEISLACLRPRVEVLLNNFAATDVMEAFDASTTPEIVAGSCHEIGHLIGKSLYARTGTIESAYEKCTEGCYNACIHGVTTAAIDAELGETADSNLAHYSLSTLRTVAKRYCETSAALCHAVGHMLRMQTTSYAEALSECDEMGLWKHECASGVFMEDAGAIETRLGGATSTPQSYRTYTEPCTFVSSTYQRACFRYAYLYHNAMFEKNGITSREEQIAISKNACNGLSDSTRANCYYGLGGAANRITFGTARGTDGFCESLPRTADRFLCADGLKESATDSIR